MNNWFKEPLLHFLLIGALLFGLYSLVNPEEASVAGNRIVVSAGDIERLSANWQKKWNRLPTIAEQQMLIDSYIREEIYYREALALGLDRNDTILRRRLMQKMEFLTNDLAELNSPSEATLEQYMLANQGKYELPARISFTHIYFSLEKHAERTLDEAEKALAALRSSADAVSRAPEWGDPFMLQHDFTLEAPFEIARLFGQDFVQRIFRLETGSWQGPVASSYGLHLVRVNEKVEAKMPELAAVINRVRTDWMSEQRQALNKEVYKRFRKRYEIVVEDQPERAVAEPTPAATMEAT